MAPSPISATSRYIPDGVTRVYWVATIADISDPTREEIDDGLDLTAEVAAVIGWRISARVVDISGPLDDFAVQIDQQLQVDDSRLHIYASQDGDDISTQLDRGDDGHVLFVHGGDVADHPMDVWPVRLVSRSRMVRIGGEPVRLDHQFAVTAAPALDVPVPA